MGVELHISRGEFWADNKTSPITLDEWLTYVESDPELVLQATLGEGFVRWLGESAYDEPWLDWFQGNISTKWPDTALYRKMLRIAKALGASVQDDDGTAYLHETDWEFSP